MINMNISKNWMENNGEFTSKTDTTSKKLSNGRFAGQTL